MQAKALAAARTTAAADAQIQKTRELINELDKLDEALEEATLLFEHIKGLRKRAEIMGGRFDRLTAQQVSVRPDPRRR